MRILDGARQRCLRHLAEARCLANLSWHVVLQDLEWFLYGPLGTRVPALWASTVLAASTTAKPAHNELHYARGRLLLDAM